MALRIGRPRRRPEWAEVRDRVISAAGSLGLADLAVAAPDATTAWAGWHEGPSVTRLAGVVGDLPGWQWAAVAPATQAPEAPAGVSGDGRLLWARRSYSERALLTGLVRFYAAQGRHFTTADERGRPVFAELLDVDDPARSGFPIADTVVDLLLAETGDPPDAGLDPDVDPQGAGPAGVDALSARLRAAGYERLWARAYTLVP